MAGNQRSKDRVSKRGKWSHETCLDPVNRIFRVDTILFFQSQIKTSDNSMEEWRSIEELRMQFHHFFQFRCAISIHFPQLWKKHVKVTRSLHPFVVPTQLEGEEATFVDLFKILFSEFVVLRIRHLQFPRFLHCLLEQLQLYVGCF